MCAVLGIYVGSTRKDPYASGPIPSLSTNVVDNVLHWKRQRRAPMQMGTYSTQVLDTSVGVEVCQSPLALVDASESEVLLSV